jgi:hypothetical protein
MSIGCPLGFRLVYPHYEKSPVESVEFVEFYLFKVTPGTSR